MQPRRPQVQRAPPRLDHHVADLAGGPAADPRLAVEDQAAPDAGPPPDAEDRVELLARAKLELGLDRHLDVVADLDGNPELLGEVLAQRKEPVQPGRLRASETTPVFSSASPGEPMPTPTRSRVRGPAWAAASRIAAAISPRDVLRARRWSGSAGATRRGPCCRRPLRRSGSWSRRGRCLRAVPDRGRGSRRRP